MQLRIRVQDFEPASSRRSVDRRIRLGLGRHASAVERARATLAPGDAHDPESAVRCRLNVRLHGGERLALEGLGADSERAAAAAAERLARRLGRERAVPQAYRPSVRLAQRRERPRTNPGSST